MFNFEKVDIYICSKPLQYLNICNIPNCSTNKKILIVQNAFYKAAEFSNNIRLTEKQWDKVYIVNGYNWFFYVLRYRVENLYFGLDTTIVGIVHFIKRFNFFLYEEGAGIYRQLQIQSKYKAIAGIIGTNTVMGRSNYISKIYVYYPDYYKTQVLPSCQVLPFKHSCREIIKEYANKFMRLCGVYINKEFYLNIKNSNILLYITDWEYQASTIKMMEDHKKDFDFLFIKPHPHIKSENMPKIDGVNVIYTNLVVEMIIEIWLQNNNSITVYHQDSTAITPFGDEIKSINTNNTKYSRVIEHIKQLSLKLNSNG